MNNAALDVLYVISGTRMYASFGSIPRSRIVGSQGWMLSFS